MPIPQELFNIVNNIAAGAAEGLNQAYNGGSSSAFLHSNYHETIEVADEVSVHFERGTSPRNLLDRKRPHETKQSKDYRLEVYQQVTWSYSQKILGLQRGALSHPQNHGVEYASPPPTFADKEGETLQDYVTGQMPDFGNLHSFVWECLLQTTQIDANGWVVLVPEFADYELPESYSELRRPYPQIIPSNHALAYGSDYLVAMSSDSVKKPQGKGYDKYVFYIFTPDVTFIAIQRDNYNTPEQMFEVLPFHEHYAGTLSATARQIGGTRTAKNTSVLSRGSQSFFVSAVEPVIPFFNIAVNELSDLRVSIAGHLHPQKYETEIPCPNTGCMDGKVYSEDLGREMTCPKCDGHGVITSATSPFTVYTVKGDAQTGEAKPPAGYLEMDTNIIDKAFDWYRYNIIEGFRAVSMEFLFEGKGGANQTARAKEIDREQLHNHFQQVANVIYPLYQWILDGINILRYGPRFKALYNSSEKIMQELKENRAVVIIPRSFDTTVTGELVERFKVAREAETPESFLFALAEETILKELGGDTEKGKKALVALYLDPLPFRSVDDLLALGAIGVTEREIEFKARLIQLINMATKEDVGFLNKDRDEQKQVLEDLFNRENPVIPPSPDLIE